MPCGRLSRISANILTTKFVMTKVGKTIIGSQLSVKEKLKIKTLRQKTLRWRDMLCIYYQTTKQINLKNSKQIFLQSSFIQPSDATAFPCSSPTVVMKDRCIGSCRLSDMNIQVLRSIHYWCGIEPVTDLSLHLWSFFTGGDTPDVNSVV